MANMLTITRFVFTFPLIYIILSEGVTYKCALLFLILGLTDYFDGYLARKYNKCTNFGKVMDGVSDKFLMLSTTICLLIKNVIPYWTLLIFIRDFFSILFALNYFKKTGIIIKSNIFGKTKTFLHITSIFLVFLLSKWNILSSILIIISIFLFIPEIFYIIKYLRCRK